MGRAPDIPQFGLDFYEGLMGSGKSFVGVFRAIQVITLQRRPVYTNLPLRWRVIRKYLELRGGARLANLLYPLKEDHWRRFITRQRERSEFRTKYSVMRPGQGEKLSSRQIDGLWYAAKGPDITQGEGANWIPPGAVIIIDEVQHWHPMSRQAQETPDLLAYITMLRHHQHWVWVMTQERGRVNNNLRNLAHYFWTVRNRGDDVLAWGLRLRHLGLRAFEYIKRTPEQEASRTVEGRRPSAVFTIWPQLPWNQVYFRLYDSFTNVGGRKQLERGLTRARAEAGVAAPVKGAEVKKKRKGPIWATVSFVLRWLRRLLLASFLIGVGVLVGMLVSKVSNMSVVKESDVAAVSSPVKVSWPRWQGIMSGAVILDGRKVAVGQGAENGATLVFVDRGRRSAVWRLAGDYWLWKWGEAGPVRVGSVDAVRSAVERLEREGFVGARPGVDGGSAGSAGGVESSGG